MGFRFYTRDVAHRATLTGWVRNTFDGSVEIEAQGSPDQLDIFMTQVKDGPPLSRVKDMQVVELPVKGDETGFVIKH